MDRSRLAAHSTCKYVKGAQAQRHGYEWRIMRRRLVALCCALRYNHALFPACPMGSCASAGCPVALVTLTRVDANTRAATGACVQYCAACAHVGRPARRTNLQRTMLTLRTATPRCNLCAARSSLGAQPSNRPRPPCRATRCHRGGARSLCCVHWAPRLQALTVAVPSAASVVVGKEHTI